MKYLFAILAIAGLNSEFSYATDSVRGCVAIHVNGKPQLKEVKLIPFEGGVLKNKLIEFQSLADDLTPAQDGSFCYSLEDDRLAYVTLYHYATNMIQDYNSVLVDLALAPIEKMPIFIEKDSTPGKCLDGARADIEGIHITFQNPALDYTTVAHEIGHYIHYQLPSSESESEYLSSERDHISEGTANILAALHLNESHISSMDFGEEFSPNVDAYVTYPISSQYHARNSFEQLHAALKQKGESCKFSEEEITNFLLNPVLQEMLDTPDAYRSSALINQPLWQASSAFGKSTVQKRYLKALMNLKTFDYQNLANQLIENSTTADSDLGDFLKKAYSERGLIKNQ